MGTLKRKASQFGQNKLRGLLFFPNHGVYKTHHQLKKMNHFIDSKTDKTNAYRTLSTGSP
jgi:hypothetical protein